MDSILKKLREQRKLNEEKELSISINDSEGNISELLKTISSYTTMGHSFHVVIDPDNEEYKKEFFIDGDGSDKLYLD